MKRKLLYTATALALATVGSAHAGVLFDPDGAPGGAAVIDVGAFDWGPTSFLAKNARFALADFDTSTQTCKTTGGCTFDVLTQGKLVGTFDPAGKPNTPAGIAANTYEITMVARYTEVVTGFLPGVNSFATFTTVTSAPMFLEMYFDSTPDAVDVSGSGFDNGDLILTGTAVASATGSFLITSTTPVLLDQHTTNQYGPTAIGSSPTAADQATVTGTGSNSNTAVGNLVTDPDFFKTALESFGISFANISIGLPYISVDPADCYTAAASGIAVDSGPTGSDATNAGKCNDHHDDTTFALQTLTPAGGVLPVTGQLNAGPTISTDSPDFVAQTDFNSPVTGRVPEPGSLALLGIGLAGLGTLARRRKA